MYEGLHQLFIAETDADLTKHSAPTLCSSHISFVSLFYNQFDCLTDGSTYSLL
jgi:hypothetical protein